MLQSWFSLGLSAEALVLPQPQSPFRTGYAAPGAAAAAVAASCLSFFTVVMGLSPATSSTVGGVVDGILAGLDGGAQDGSGADNQATFGQADVAEVEEAKSEI
ncbi:hypothetical protein BDZ97DRAFT_2066513 [Flammula alnicola]|nr:hypothetical protein BDZ97DRAFT_2066513 [Flammula alnicola]